VQTMLKGTLRLLQLYETDHLSRVRSITENHDLQTIVAPILTNPGKASVAQIKALEDLITPLYKSRGFVGYTLIRNNQDIVASTSANIVGTKVRTPESKEALLKAMENGTAMSRPTLANFPIRTNDQSVSSGVIFQLACGRIVRAGDALGFLCLRLDPQINLYPLLKTNHYGETGEAYLIDRTGRILTPSRVE
jgi:two-component system sensor histidine kinase/response regulator